MEIDFRVNSAVIVLHSFTIAASFNCCSVQHVRAHVGDGINLTVEEESLYSHVHGCNYMQHWQLYML